jgi:dUTP pyrophosphatase
LSITGSEKSAGYDLYSAYDYNVTGHSAVAISTDLQILVPKGTYARIAPRSGLALNCFIGVGGGVIDADYTGNVTVILFNHAKNVFRVLKGDRIAQLICEKYKAVNIQVVDGDLPPTQRGAAGFGSTNI